MQRPWEQATLQERVPQRPQDDPVEELQLMSRVCRSCHSQEAVVSPRPFPGAHCPCYNRKLSPQLPTSGSHCDWSGITAPHPARRDAGCNGSGASDWWPLGHMSAP